MKKNSSKTNKDKKAVVEEKKQQSLGAVHTHTHTREFQFKQENNNCNFAGINNYINYNTCNRNIKQKAKKHNSRSTKNKLKLTKQ